MTIRASILGAVALFALGLAGCSSHGTSALPNTQSQPFVQQNFQQNPGTASFPLPGGQLAPANARPLADANGNVWFLTSSPGGVAEITGGGAFTAFPAPGASSPCPTQLTAAAAGTLYALDDCNAKVDVVTTLGVYKQFAYGSGITATSSGSTPFGAVVGSDGALYFVASTAGGYVMEHMLTTTGVFTNFTFSPQPVSAPATLVAGPTGFIYGAAPGGLYQFTLATHAYRLTSWPAGFTPSAGAAPLAYWKGALYTIGHNGSNGFALTAVTTAGVASTSVTFPANALNASSDLSWLVVGQDGDLYAGLQQDASSLMEIWRITQSGTGASLTYTASGPLFPAAAPMGSAAGGADGNLWFVTSNAVVVDEIHALMANPAGGFQFTVSTSSTARLVVSEADPAGALTVTSGNTAIATVALESATEPGIYKVTAVGTGQTVIHITDTLKNTLDVPVTVQSVGVNTAQVAYVAGNGTAADLDGAGSGAEFNAPYFLGTDSSGNTYTSDNGTAIRKITPGGVVTTVATGLTGASGIVADASGNLYVGECSNDDIRKITAAGVVTTFAGTPGATGYLNATGTAARFGCVQGLARDTSGNIYAADAGNDVIRKITTTGVVTTLAGHPGVAGNYNATGMTAQFNNPFGVAVDTAKNVYVTDQANNEIRKITSLGVVTTLAGGATGYLNATKTAAQFNTPVGIAVNAAGTVFVADELNHVIRAITSAGVVTLLAGIPNASGSTQGPALGVLFTAPTGLGLDAAGNLYIADQGANYVEVEGVTAQVSPGATPSPTPTPAHAPGTDGPALTGPTYGYCSGCFGGYGPIDVANTFDFPVQSGYYGTGQTIAIVIDYSPNIAGDVSTYLGYFGTPGSIGRITTRNVDGGAKSDTSSLFEATLDTETIAGLAPGANIIIYLTPDLNAQHIIDAYTQIESDGLASVVSSSFGQCEYEGTGGEDTLLAQGAARGIAFIASSGDQGNECPGGSSFKPGVNFPASDPNVIGVGGTETFPTGGIYQLANPVVWNDDNFGGGQGASGGGVSAIPDGAGATPAFTPFPIPSYQVGVSGLASASDRNVPDVAMPAEYTAIYLQGAWEQGLGTSWSAPEFAAMMAEIYEYCGQTIGASPPIANPLQIPYYAYAHAPSDFMAVTSGNNQYKSGTPFYTASGAYSNATGLGVPYGMNVATTYCPGRVPQLIGRVGHGVAYAQHAAVQATSVNVTPNVSGMSDLGERAASAPTRVQLVIRPTATIAQDEATVVSALEAAGFAIEQRFSNHLVVDAQAPSSTVERFFSTRLHDFAQGQYGTRYAPTSVAVIPASINPYIAGITLDSVVTTHTGPRAAPPIRR